MECRDGEDRFHSELVVTHRVVRSRRRIGLVGDEDDRFAGVAEKRDRFAVRREGLRRRVDHTHDYVAFVERKAYLCSDAGLHRVIAVGVEPARVD